MKRYFLIILWLFPLLFPLSSSAQFQFSGELRPRTEIRHGYGSPYEKGQEAAFFTSQRTRLNFFYSQKDFRVGISLQDVRTWGDVKQLNASDKNGIMLHEAWGELILLPELSLKLGRQELVYDNQRILGNVGWAQQARSHDVALLKFSTDEVGTLHLGLAYNQDMEQKKTRFYSVAGNYRDMQMLWYNRGFENLKLSLLFLNAGFQNLASLTMDESTHYVQTMGTYMTYKLGEGEINVSGYYQTGEDINNRDLNAFLISCGYTRSFSSHWVGSLGFEIQSGTETTNQGPEFKNKSFTPLFGTNHKFNGHMDYFYVGNHGSNVGLQDYFAGLKYNKAKISFGADLHLFASYASLYDINGPDAKEMNKYLGAELDLSLGYKISDQVGVKVGYSHMFDTKSMEVLKKINGDKANYWSWFMVVFKPQFINQ